MTNSPAGWYPSAPGSAQLRYWDGADWTEHVSEPLPTATQSPIAVAPTSPSRAPEGTNPTTPWAWLLAVFPVIALTTYIPLGFYLQGFTALGTGPRLNPDAVVEATLSPIWFVSVGIGLVLDAAAIVASWLDFRELSRRGVPQPFHWAWSFLGIVYIIGRSVVVYRRTGTGRQPLWVFIAAESVAFVVSITFSIILTIEILSVIANVTVTQLAQIS